MIILLFILISSFMVIRIVKEKIFEIKIINRFKRIEGKEYRIGKNIRRIVKGKNRSKRDCELKNSYKLVYEMNFECSVCLAKLKEIYGLYKRLLKRENIKFLIITKEKSDSYIKYFLNKELKNYDICVVNQKPLLDGTDLYLLDKSNKIIMAGDIWSYPFLKKEYLKSRVESKSLWRDHDEQIR